MTTTHFHAMGEPEDFPRKKNGTLRKMSGPVNGCCRCKAHIANPLKATRARPACTLECYLCERVRVLAAKLSA